MAASATPIAHYPTAAELEDILPDPDVLAELAEQTPPKISVERYWGAISTLRGKNYSWPEIATWLSNQGVDLHYKRLERYAKALEMMDPEEIEADEGE